jgi:hypothetical protein
VRALQSHPRMTLDLHQETKWTTHQNLNAARDALQYSTLQGLRSCPRSETGGADDLHTVPSKPPETIQHLPCHRSVVTACFCFSRSHHARQVPMHRIRTFASRCRKALDAKCDRTGIWSSHQQPLTRATCLVRGRGRRNQQTARGLFFASSNCLVSLFCWRLSLLGVCAITPWR